MKFEKQDYQEQCVKNIIDALKDFDFTNPSAEDLQSCLNYFYKNEGKDIPDKTLSGKLNLDILMETGTGKTFTYIKTMFELHKEHGIKKFIIFVPRKAIRLGIKQNIELTNSYFKEDYGTYLKLFEYDGKDGKSKVRTFIESTDSEPSVLLLTDSAINKKKKNILRQPQEKKTFFNSKNTLLEGLQAIKPVIIIDEPHLLKGEKFIEIFKEFQSLYLRFGATFPKNTKDTEHKLSNMVYSLDSISSFQERLVKKIQVSTIINSNHAVKLKTFNTKNKTATWLYFKNGEELSKTINWHDDIGIKLNLPEWNGIYCINAKKDTLYLSNNTAITNKQDNYVLDETEQQQLIKATIKAHFQKEERLFKKGIKTLSLFFIKNINDFKGDNPIIKKIFEEEYKKAREEKLQEKISKKYKEYLEQDYIDGNLRVNNGYFADSKGTKEAQESKDVELILNKKEELLSLKTPLRFIFSVWALQEGWDNPNIFNLCKLAPSPSETSKRQQVGRGLRLAVNQHGKRLSYKYLEENDAEFYNINNLDVIVSGQEKQFIESLQEEINESSYKILDDTLTTALLKEKAQLNDREANRLLINLEDNKIIEHNQSKDNFTIKLPIYEYIQDNKEPLLTFLSEDSYSNLLECFKQPDNKQQQVSNANKQKAEVTVNASLFKEFKELWQTINKQASMSYSNLNEDEIIKNITTKFCTIVIEPVKIKIKIQSFNAQTGNIEEKEENTLGEQKFFNKPNLLADYIFSISKEEQLPLPFVLKLLNTVRNNPKGKQNIQNNPKRAKRELITCIKECIHQHIISKISYNFTNNIRISNNAEYTLPLYDNQELKPIISTNLGKFVSKETPKDNYLYSHIVYDSKIEEDITISDPPRVDDNKITVFAKLPKISIPTPYKSYNPDFAYLIQTNLGKTLFLIVETKGYDSEQNIAQEETNKIEYAKQFFKDLQATVPNIQIEFKKRINKQTLLDVLNSIQEQP